MFVDPHVGQVGRLDGVGSSRFEDTIPKLVNYFDENSELNYYEHLADEVGGHQLSKEACEYRKQQCRKYNAAKREEPTPSNLPTIYIHNSCNKIDSLR